MPVWHRNLTPPSICLLSHLGGGEMHPAYAAINYVAELREMVVAEPSMFQSPGGLQRKAAQVVVAALLASEDKLGSPQNPRVLEPPAEGGRVRGPPQRDKQPTRFNIGSSLQERDQARVLAMLDYHVIWPFFSQQ